MHKEFPSSQFSWKFNEFEPQHSRGTLWYVVAGLIVGSLLVYSMVTENYLFAVLVLMTTLVLFSHQIYTPPVMTCVITGDGVVLNDRSYAFDEFETFWIVQNSDGHFTLNFKVKKGLLGVLVVPLPEVEAAAIQSFLLERLDEDGDYVRESASEWIWRKLKL